MQINPKLIKKQFEKSLNTYSQNAVVQKVMAEKLVDNLQKVRVDFENILELGCGTGILTNEIVKKINFKNYCANDLIEKSKFYVEDIIPKTKFYCGNAQHIKLQQKQDLIISNAMFQWFKNLEKASLYYKKALKPSGILAFTSFSEKNFSEIRELTGISLDYLSFQDIKKAIEKNYKILYSEEFEQKLSFSNPLELLAHMKNTGVNSLTLQHWTFGDVKKFCEDYNKRFPDITLTYSPVIVICSNK